MPWWFFVWVYPFRGRSPTYPPSCSRLGGITDSPLCRACMETEETPIHVMLQCNGVAEQRAAHLGSSATLDEAFGDLGGLLSFWSELGWLE
ncbi:jg7034 [Pararge aegeria aegeria]|uniref:Jg7034 protein n=1 Tax=Pararge aegeria aegeria TaxID=348720 RepID=A0A8S4RIE1_9NEOP|nr:jg7034 [Pararge aegeria aegeria]